MVRVVRISSVLIFMLCIVLLSVSASSVSFEYPDSGSHEVDPPANHYTPSPSPYPRINREDVAAPVALFCKGDGIDIYTIANSRGTFLTYVSNGDIVRARQQAQNSGTNTAIFNNGTVSLWVLNTGETQVNSGEYARIFSYEAICGSLPNASELQPQQPRDEFVIINRPR